MSIHFKVVFAVACIVQSFAIAEPLPPIPETTYEIIDVLSYSQQTAQTLWKPITGSKSVSLVEIEGKKALKMPCNFHGTKFDRASWDKELKPDFLWQLTGLGLSRFSSPPAPSLVFILLSSKRLGMDTEIMVFPDEPHGLSCAGRADRRIAHSKHILRWFDIYLKGR